MDRKKLRDELVKSYERKTERVQGVISKNLSRAVERKCKRLNITTSSAIEQLLQFWTSESEEVIADESENRNQLMADYNKLTQAFNQELILEDLDDVQKFLTAEDKKKDNENFDDMINAQ